MVNKLTMRFIMILSVLLPFAVGAQNYTDHFSAQGQYDAQFTQTEMKYAFEDYKGSNKKWQKKFRAELSDLLGVTKLGNIYKDFVPRAEFLYSEDLGDVTRERWQIWTEPSMVIPFVLLRPKTMPQEKMPLIITPQGHDKNPEIYSGVYDNEEELKSIHEKDKDIALQAVRKGYIAINPTTRGFGKTKHPHDADAKNSCRYYHLRGLIAGRTLIGDRVWDLMKTLDWALDNLPVDSEKVVVAGNSGGGTMSLYAGALDSRIKVCVCSSAFCSFESSIGSISHCHCNHLPGIMNLCNMGDIAGLVAPRKLLISNGVLDRIFPIDGARNEFLTVQVVYESFGAADNCEMYEGAGGHRFFQSAIWEYLGRNL